MEEGWIRLHRKTVDSRVFSDPALFHTWCAILMRVNWKSGYFKTVEIMPGELAFSWRNLPDRLHPASDNAPCVNTMRRRIQKLETFGMVETRKQGRQFSILTVVNWQVYQPVDTPPDTPSDTPVDTPPDTRGDTDRRRVRREEGKKPSSAWRHSREDMAIASWMFKKLQGINPGHKRPNLESWANDVRLIRERDARTPEQIRWLFEWANRDDFWQANIQSPLKLRKKWDQLVVKAKAEHAKQTDPRGNIAMVEEMIAGGDFE